MPELGIGIITRNRLATLAQCAAEIARHTRVPYALAVADDGSSDETAAWVRGAGIPLIAGPRRGCAWNKNRALRYFATRTDCDPILLFEDDTWPVADGWDDLWVAAARRWGHVNYFYGYEPEGGGTVDDPYQGTAFGGQCTITTRAALAEVGYLDTRFVGYGVEHVEWTHRYRVRYTHEWNLPKRTVPCLDFGVLASWPPSHYDEAEITANRDLFYRLRDDESEPVYRAPWRDDDEREQLEAEVGRAAGPRAGREVDAF